VPHDPSGGQQAFSRGDDPDNAGRRFQTANARTSNHAEPMSGQPEDPVITNQTARRVDFASRSDRNSSVHQSCGPTKIPMPQYERGFAPFGPSRRSDRRPTPIALRASSVTAQPRWESSSASAWVSGSNVEY